MNGESPAGAPEDWSHASGSDEQPAAEQPAPAGQFGGREQPMDGGGPQSAGQPIGGGGPPGADQPIGGAGQPTEEELREAYEAELSRITSAEMVLQAAVSLLNIGGYRLGLAAAPGADPGPERDLDQVRDAIDGVRGLMPVLERSMPAEIAPLRDALSRLQMAYAREAGQTATAAPPTAAGEPAPAGHPAAASPQQPNPARGPDATEDKQPPKGPAESSGRLWVPGR